LIAKDNTACDWLTACDYVSYTRNTLVIGSPRVTMYNTLVTLLVIGSPRVTMYNTLVTLLVLGSPRVTMYNTLVTLFVKLLAEEAAAVMQQV
jgi:hypothetical protein